MLSTIQTTWTHQPVEFALKWLLDLQYIYVHNNSYIQRLDIFGGGRLLNQVWLIDQQEDISNVLWNYP